MSGELSDDPVGDVKFWLMMLDNARRTIICSPELESRVKSRIAAMGIGGLVTVRVSRVCSDERLIVIDENAIQAETNRALSQWRPHL